MLRRTRQIPTIVASGLPSVAMRMSTFSTPLPKRSLVRGGDSSTRPRMSAA